MSVQSLQITCQGGLEESQEPTRLGAGQLQELLNWVPEPTGGLRVRPKWFKGSEDSAPTTRHCKGMGLFQRFTTPKIRQSATTYTRDAITSGTIVITPTFVWPQPTILGNTLVALVTAVSTDTTSVTFTADGWVTRLSVDGPQASVVPFVGAYELVTDQVYTGTVSPFTFVLTNTTTTLFIEIRLMELTGVGDFDQLVEVDTHVGSNSADFGTTVTGAVNPQDSMLMLAFAASQASAINPAVAYSLNTASDGWMKNTETSLAWRTAPGKTAQATNTVWSKITSAAETPEIVITEDLTGTHNTADCNAVLLTYKGWDADPSPGDKRDFLLAADDNGSTYDIYGIVRETMDVSTWDLLDAALGDSTSGSPVSFALGLGAVWYTAPSFLGLRRYDGAAHTVSSSPGNARSVTFHRDRIWAASGSRLSWCQIGDGFTWPNSTDNTGSGYFDVNLDDGEEIECIAPFAGLLVVGKRTSTYVVTGRDALEFALEPLPGGDCAPGQSIVATPYGCVIAGRKMVYILGANSSALTISNNVLSVQPLGRAIEGSYSVGTDEFVWCDYIDGSLYVTVGSSGKTFVYSFETKSWRIEMVDDGTVEAPAVTFSYDNVQYYGPVAGVIGSLANYRHFPHGARGKDFDDLTMSFSAQTGDITPAGVRHPFAARQFYAQVRQRDGTDSEIGLTVTPVFNGELGEACEIAAGNIGVRREVVAGFPQIDVGTGLETIGVRLEQDVPAGQTAVYDIEDMFLDVNIEQARV